MLPLTKNNKKIYIKFNQKTDAVISFALGFIGVLVFFYTDLISMYFCSDKLYTSNFSECKEHYQQWSLIVSSIFCCFGFLFLFRVLLKDKIFYGLYLKLFCIITIIGGILTILFWGDAGGGFFIRINFGLIFAGLTVITIILTLLSVTWGHMFKRRLYGSVLIFMLLAAAVSFQEVVYLFSEQAIFGSTNEDKDCNGSKLYRVRDKCLFGKGIHEDNIQICDLISADSIDQMTDCRNFIYRNRGSGDGDKKWCDLITDRYQKSLCVK